MPDIICMGEMLIDFVASEKGYGIGDAPGFIPVPGGAPANVAVGAALLGGSAGFIGKVGDDPFGTKLARVLESHGVDTTAVSFAEHARTMLAFVSLTEAGDRDFIFYRHPSADMLITPEDVPEGYLENIRCFHFGSISLIGEPSRSTTLALVEKARNAGALVSFDPNVRMNLWPDADAAREEIMKAIPLAHVIKLSGEEAELLVRESDPKRAGRLIEMMGPGLAAVTLADRGCVAVTARYGVEVAGHKTEVQDTTGAGDAFTAAMLVKLVDMGGDILSNPGLLGDLELIRIFQFANAAGALTTTATGAIPALPSRDQVEAFLERERSKALLQ
jgi:fructokinase